MATTTQITNIAHLLDLTDYAGDFVDDYDMDAVHADYLAAINDEMPLDGVTVCANGDVIADLDAADDARELDWKAVADHVGAQPIFERHDVTSRITCTYDADGFGKVIREGRDAAGDRLVVWGPDTRDADGQVVDEITDEHWIGTLWDNDTPRSTNAGTRDEIEALARRWMKA